MDKLSKVVSEEVPGTLSSLKLSGLEINELTQQLDKLRYCESLTLLLELLHILNFLLVCAKA